MFSLIVFLDNLSSCFYLQTTLWANLHPNQVIGTPAIVKEIDCSTATVDEILEVRSHFSSTITEDGARLCALGGWFDVHFRVCYCIIIFIVVPVLSYCLSRNNRSLKLQCLIYQGSEQNPAIQEVELTTAPSADQGTHWGQQVCISDYTVLSILWNFFIR